MAAPLWADRAGHLRMRRLSDRYANLCGLLTQLALGAEPFSEDHTMPPSPTNDSPLPKPEPSTSEQSCALTDRDTQQFQTGFTPLHPNGLNCLLGFRSDASASELYDEAMMRHHAALGLLCALSGTPELNSAASEPLNGCIQAVRLLFSDAAGLHSAAWDRMQQETT